MTRMLVGPTDGRSFLYPARLPVNSGLENQSGRMPNGLLLRHSARL